MSNRQFVHPPSPSPHLPISPSPHPSIPPSLHPSIPSAIPQFAIPPILSDTPLARTTVTYATQITLFRILLIPVFIAVAIYYGDSVSHGHANETLRWTTIAIFAVAAISDAIDGYVARHFNQKSRIGAILDPLADKLLLLSAIITLSFTGWRQHFPLWFPILVIFRDVASIGGAFLINHLIGKCHIQPHWTGKVATFAQFAAVLWLMLDIPHLVIITVFAGLFTAISGFLNLAAGIRQVTQTDPATPGP